MDLSKVELLPGAIINVDDPNKTGRIKAVVPTLFDTSTMSEDALPWIPLLHMGGQQHFSKMIVGGKVWVLADRKNREFWYWPLFELHEDVKEKIDDYDDAEVLLARSIGDSSVLVYYNNTDGMNIKIGDSTFINLTTDSKVIIKAAEGEISISDSKVHLGKTGNDNEDNVAKAKPVSDALNSIYKILQQLKASATGPYVCALQPGFLPNEMSSLQQNMSIDTIKAESTFAN